MTKLTIKWFNAKCNQYEFNEIIEMDESTPQDMGEIMQAMILDERFHQWELDMESI